MVKFNFIEFPTAIEKISEICIIKGEDNEK